VNSELILIGSWSEREPRGGADWERLVKTGRKSPKEGSVIGGSRGGGDPQEGDCSVQVDFGSEGKGECTVG